MKSPADCLEELLEDDQIYMIALTSMVDESLSASLIKSLCRGEGERDIITWGKEIRFAIMNKIHERAAEMSEASRSPDFESNESDIRREQ